MRRGVQNHNEHIHVQNIDLVQINLTEIYREQMCTFLKM